MLKNFKANFHPNFFKKSLTYFLAMALLMIAHHADAITISKIEGTFSHAQGDDINSLPALFNLNTVNNIPVAFGNGEEDQIRWGLALPGDDQSGLGFTGAAPPDLTVNIDEEFEIGQLRHFNTPILVLSGPLSVDLGITLEFSDPVGVNQSFDFTFAIVENNNALLPPGSDDVISFSSSFANETFDIGGVDHTLELLGFKINGNLLKEFRSPEDSTSNAVLVARINPVPEPSTMFLVALGLGGLMMSYPRKSKKVK